jgi:hypothetical protein
MNTIPFLILKSKPSNIDPSLILFGIIALVILLIISVIYSSINSRNENKIKEQKAIIENSWANDEGKAFFEKIKSRLRNNESAPVDSFEELKGLSDLTKESINNRFGVSDKKYEYRIPLSLEFLNERYKAENLELIGITDEQAQTEHGINLNNDELLYEMYDECAWFELKRSQQRSWNYHGLGLRIPLGGGLSYRLGSIQNLNPDNLFEYKEISKGKVFLTNKRIIFQGESENKTVTLKSLLDIEQYNDSCVIGKSTGKKPIIKFQFDDAAIFSRKLSRLFETV